MQPPEDGVHVRPVDTAGWLSGAVFIGFLVLTGVAALLSIVALLLLFRKFGQRDRRLAKKNGCSSPPGGVPQPPRRPAALRSPAGPPAAPPRYPRASPPGATPSPASPPQPQPPQQPLPHGDAAPAAPPNHAHAPTAQTTPPETLGLLHFTLRYDEDKGGLVVSVVRCEDLPSKEAGLGSCDPYVKLQLLPDKQHKVKTRVVRKTCNPVYEEDFTFYGLTRQRLDSITLHFVVLSFDRYSRDDIIGEVLCPLSGVELLSRGTIALSREIQPRSLKMRSVGRGELLVSLCWQPAAGRLTVVLLKARNLPKMDVTGLADPYVKMYLLYNGQRIAKKKTHVKKRTLNPIFNESFAFDVPGGGGGEGGEGGLEGVSLELLVLDWDRVTKNEVIGRLELGAGGHHWREVVSAPRRQIADWHKLTE